MFSLFSGHMQGVQPAYKKHITTVYGSITQRACSEISYDKSCEAVIVVLIEDRKMVLHTIPVQRVKPHAAGIVPVRCGFHLFKAVRQKYKD